MNNPSLLEKVPKTQVARPIPPGGPENKVCDEAVLRARLKFFSVTVNDNEPTYVFDEKGLPGAGILRISLFS